MIEKYGVEGYELHKERCAKWREKNREKSKELWKEYCKKNPEYVSKYFKSKKGRALNLISTYSKEDERRKRGKCTLTKEQLIQLWDNGCYYCGETDWHKLGADRIDNSKPHTLENVVCCCASCNRKRGTMNFTDFCDFLK